jgi:hypothetical protein
VRHTAAYDFQPRSAVRSMLWSIPSRERIEERHERLEEHRIVQQAIDPAELLGSRNNSGGSTDSNSDG